MNSTSLLVPAPACKHLSFFPKNERLEPHPCAERNERFVFSQIDVWHVC